MVWAFFVYYLSRRVDTFDCLNQSRTILCRERAEIHAGTRCCDIRRQVGGWCEAPAYLEHDALSKPACESPVQEEG